MSKNCYHTIVNDGEQNYIFGTLVQPLFYVAGNKVSWL